MFAHVIDDRSGVVLVTAGDFRLAIQAADLEFTAGWTYEPARDAPPHPSVIQELTDFPDDIDIQLRIARTPGLRLRVDPVLPDRPIVARTETRLVVAPSTTTRIHVSCALWLRLSVEDGKQRAVLKEIPAVEPRETWFGSPGGAGDLCYATRTRARLTRDNDLPLNRCRIETVVYNRQEAPLVLDTLRLPVDRLALTRDSDGALCTQSVEILHNHNGATEFRLGPFPRTVLAPPRVRQERSFLAKAFELVTPEVVR